MISETGNIGGSSQYNPGQNIDDWSQHMLPDNYGNWSFNYKHVLDFLKKILKTQVARVTDLEYAPCMVIGPKNENCLQNQFYLTKIGPNAMQGAYSKPVS